MTREYLTLPCCEGLPQQPTLPHEHGKPAVWALRPSEGCQGAPHALVCGESPRERPRGCCALAHGSTLGHAREESFAPALMLWDMRPPCRWPEKADENRRSRRRIGVGLRGLRCREHSQVGVQILEAPTPTRIPCEDAGKLGTSLSLGFPTCWRCVSKPSPQTTWSNP